MIFVRCAEVNHSQRCKDESLQRNNQDVEDSPGNIQRPLDPQWQKRDQNEYHLAGIHVTEQTQCQTDGLDDQGQDFEHQIERHQRPMIEGIE